MASPAKTSSSSISCRTNPNMKKSELCDPTRRSFSGNPFTKPYIITNLRAFDPNTPANSPSGSIFFCSLILFIYFYFRDYFLLDLEEGIQGLSHQKNNIIIYLSAL